MPKRGKRKKGDGREEFEGRPADLTFGAFLQTAGNSSSVSLSLQQEEDAEADDSPSAQASGHSESASESQEFVVTRTKKGKLPISYENRSKGKKVTVISNVSGNADILVAELRKRLGVGGVSRGTFVELQGDQQRYVEEFLSRHPCVK